MNLSTHVYRGLAALALCAAASVYATSHPGVAVGAPEAIPMLGTITVSASQSDFDVVYAQVQGNARVTVGEPVTLGPRPAAPRFAMQQRATLPGT